MSIRVTIHQPALPHYRVPVFAELARRPGLDLTVLYGSEPDITNVSPQGFAGRQIQTRRWRLAGRTLHWNPAQLASAHRGSADVLVFNWNVQHLSLLPALLKARRAGVGTLLWGHGYSKHEARWRRWPRHFVARRADGLVLYNHIAADRLAQAGFEPARLFVALNAIDQEPIQRCRNAWLADPAGLAAFRREQGLAQGPVVLFVSRLDPDNRLEVLLQAAARLRRPFPGLRVVVVGQGEPEAARLRRVTADLDLQAHVTFTGALHDQMRLAPWFLCADAFCYPANIGLSVLHALGYGLPVVTGDDLASHNPEIEALRDGENGLLFRHGDAADLARVLTRLFGDPALRQRLSQAALATVREEFTLSRMVDAMEAAIRFAAARRRQTP